MTSESRFAKTLLAFMKKEIARRSRINGLFLQMPQSTNTKWRLNGHERPIMKRYLGAANVFSPASPAPREGEGGRGGQEGAGPTNEDPNNERSPSPPPSAAHKIIDRALGSRYRSPRLASPTEFEAAEEDSLARPTEAIYDKNRLEEGPFMPGGTLMKGFFARNGRLFFARVAGLPTFCSATTSVRGVQARGRGPPVSPASARVRPRPERDNAGGVNRNYAAGST